jgi:hypothetical protein
MRGMGKELTIGVPRRGGPVTPSRHRRFSLVIWIALYGSTMGPNV